jgi:hypothetical protein
MRHQDEDARREQMERSESAERTTRSDWRRPARVKQIPAVDVVPAHGWSTSTRPAVAIAPGARDGDQLGDPSAQGQGRWTDDRAVDVREGDEHTAAARCATTGRPRPWPGETTQRDLHARGTEQVDEGVEPRRRRPGAGTFPAGWVVPEQGAIAGASRASPAIARTL